MESFLPILLVLAFITIGGLIAYFSYLERKRRREAMAALAAELGWEFTPDWDSTHDEEYSHFEVFRRGHSRRAENSMTGSLVIRGRPFFGKMGDFQYKVTSGSGKTRNTTTYQFSYLILHLPFARVPDLLIRPEGMFDKLTGFLGFEDINFESAEFSRRFYVKSPDKRFAYDVIHARMMEFLLASERATIDIEFHRCCICEDRQRWSIPEFKQRLRWAQQFFELWPDHLLAELDR